jgi:hypothetical protein
MADVFTKAKRSEVMSRIRGRGNKDTELALVRLLRAYRFSGWRKHVLVAVDGSRLRIERRKRHDPDNQTPILDPQLDFCHAAAPPLPQFVPIGVLP